MKSWKIVVSDERQPLRLKKEWYFIGLIKKKCNVQVSELPNGTFKVKVTKFGRGEVWTGDANHLLQSVYFGVVSGCVLLSLRLLSTQLKFGDDFWESYAFTSLWTL